MNDKQEGMLHSCSERRLVCQDSIENDGSVDREVQLKGREEREGGGWINTLPYMLEGLGVKKGSRWDLRKCKGHKN